MSTAEKPRKASVRTFVDTSDIFERGEKEHEDDAHAKDLYASAGHVEHERLHRQGLYRRKCDVPCSCSSELIV